MKKRKYFIGLVLMFTVVSLNIRHAWMNYGIYRHVEAGVPSARIVICDIKEGYDLIVNLEQKSMDIKVHCEVGLKKEYYKRDENGNELPIGTEIYNYRTDTRTTSPMNANLEEADRTESTHIYDLLPSTAYYCGEHKDNECCYAKSAEMDCSILVKQTY